MSTKDGLRDLRIYYFHADRAHRNEPNPSPKESLVRLAAERAAKHDAGGRRSGSDDQQLRSGGTAHIRITKAKALKDELSSTRKRTAGGSIRPAKRHSPVKFLLGNECTSLPMARQRAVSH